MLKYADSKEHYISDLKIEDLKHCTTWKGILFYGDPLEISKLHNQVGLKLD